MYILELSESIIYLRQKDWKRSVEKIMWNLKREEVYAYTEVSNTSCA